MRFQKTQNRKQKRIQKKLFLFGGFGLFLILCLTGFFIFTTFVMPQALFVSPLSANASNGDKSMTKDQVKKLISDRRIGVDSVVVTPDSTFLVKLTDKGEVLLSPDKDMTQQVASLQVILTRLTMEGKRFKRLDMRFDKPVISQ